MINYTLYSRPVMLCARRFGFLGHIMAAGGAIGKISKRKKLNTTRFYTEIGGGEVARQKMARWEVRGYL